MYLKRLELHGFKSFAPKTTLEFSPGVTGIVGPNGSGKCLEGSSLVTLADGREVPIRTLVEDALNDSSTIEALDDGFLTRANPHCVNILSLNPATLRLETRPVAAFVKRSAPERLLRIRTRAGREVTATPYHPLFTLENGCLRALKAEELTVGVRVALPRQLPVSSDTVRIQPLETMKLFAEEDRVYIPNSPELRTWATETRTSFGTWEQWRQTAEVPYTQFGGFVDGQAVNTAVLTKMARVAETPPPIDGTLKSHGRVTIRVPATMTSDLARFLGLLVAEGRTSVEGNIWFVNTDTAINDEFVRLASTLFNVKVFRQQYKKNAEDCIIFSRTLGLLLERLFDFPIHAKSAAKQVPSHIFLSDEKVQWAFLSGLFEGDAHVCVKIRGEKTLAYIEYTTASMTLAQQVASLLLRLGVFATIRAKEKYASNTIEKRRRTYYSVYIYGSEQLHYSAQRLSFIGEKQCALQALLEIPLTNNPNRDVVPGATSLVKEAARLARVSVKRHRRGRAKLAAYVEERCEASRSGLREVVRQIVEVGEVPECASACLDRLKALADSDVYWDEIVSIERIAPPEPWVFDLSVAETHNFVAQNIIVHNSNVADAIRWVLGEQSMRQLRGKKSDDVIFAGGQGRASAQMAEVTLVLDNSSAWLPSEYSEVTVTRRSFRSGDSEYLINGSRVRLRDVLLLLAQARIGHDSYTVIGQGMVDQALSARADERRALFEDAAGIRQFQAQRNEAEQKLALTQSNLARLRDIIGEIEPRLAPLAEQARRARDFTSTRDELNALLRVWYRRQWREQQDAVTRAQVNERTLAERQRSLTDALAVEEALAQERREQREALLGAMGALRRERGETLSRLQATERELAVGRERLTSLDRQETELEAEQQQQSEAVETAQAQVEGLEAQAMDAEEQVALAGVALEKLERALHAARQEQEREEARLRATQREVIQAQARLGAGQTELGRLQRQLGERNRALAARRESAAQAQRAFDAAQAALGERRQAFDAARAAVEALVAQREQAQRELAEQDAEVERLRAAVADAQRERRAAADRLALLEEWRRNRDGFDAGLRALLNAPEASRPPLLGVVAELVSAPAGLELAIETALGPFLSAAVVATADDGRRAGDWLREQGAGRAYFLWPDEAQGEATAPLATPAMPEADSAELFGFAREALICREELRPVFARLLGPLYIVRDLGVADARWGGGPLPAQLVTLDGQLLHPAGWLRGGAQRVGNADAKGGAGQRGRDEAQPEASVLARERELRQLPAEIDRLAVAIVEAQAQQERAVATRKELAGGIESLRREAQSAETHAQERARAVATVQREQERAQGEASLGQAVAEQLAAEVEGLEQEVAATAARVAEQEATQQEIAERAEEIQDEVDELLDRNRSAQEEHARARTTLAVQRQEVKALNQRAEQLRAQTHELEAQIQRRGERLQAIKLQRAHLLEVTEAQDEELGGLRERARELSDELRAREGRQADLERQIQELERGQNAERQELARVEVEARRAVVESQRAAESLDALARQIREELAADGADVAGQEPGARDPLLALLTDEEDAADRPRDSRMHGADLSPNPSPSQGDEGRKQGELSAEDAAKLRRQIDQLRNQLKRLGGYDPDAPQQYEELKTRHDFLSGQVRDMEQASANLRTVIAELDTMMRRQFEATFHAVNERFQHNFTTLFNGGAARLELTAPRRAQAEEDDDEGEPEQRAPAKNVVGGIEIYAQIPGKKVQDLTLLSGGERAMVSAALLFALLETNPPPFCLLDEVDAALDEANVVRFCQILTTRAEATQFIVITHNRVTMTYTDAIYGVSMNAGSVSNILSMRLAEAQAVGAR